ncbi:MAG TPA: DUF885 domain-containing protein [Acidimicrobiia bacterium]|nr:DUF885 domain-containing protein [Acidimicrobiia bacterium]
MSLQTLADLYWAKANEMAPTVATVRGVHDYDDILPGLDDGWRAKMASAFRGILQGAEALETAGMTIQEEITRALLVHQSRSALDQIETPFLLTPIDPFLGPHIRLLSDTRQNTVQTGEQADALLGRYARVPEFLSAALAMQTASARSGQSPATAALSRVMSQVDGYLASELGDDPFLSLQVPEGQGTWFERAVVLVNETIRPAFQAYRDGLEEIAPLARPDDRPGLVWMPDGEDIYRRLIGKYTQLDATAEEVHETGLRWATEINAAEWVEIGSRALEAHRREDVFQRLHDDSSLRFDSEGEMLDHARAALDRAWAVVDDWFGARPETPCQVVPVPAAMAPAMPPAYYMQPPIDGSRPGTYFLNTFKPEERDRFEYESIHFHEGIPGHHFDRSLAAELDGIPTFRRYAQVYAHTEGWGLYSERLADEMGLYTSDIDRLGMISADAWRAGRLVTDTGMHGLGWSRDQAIEFLETWTPIGRLTIEQEVDRYIGMPAQALSYKMGQLEIMRLRDVARSELGDGFDIKGFHDTMLVNGAMPLPMLEIAVREWMDGLPQAK